MRRAVLLPLFVLPIALANSAELKTPETVVPARIREEPGVNQFTTPSIEVVMQALHRLRPVPYEQVARELTARNPGDRARLALSTGGIIADGLLAVIAEKQSRIEPIGRALLRQAKGLGVGDHVTRHSKSILEKAAKKDWPGVRAGLIGAQRDVEKGMLALRDEEIAHLVALGGWWRGLEISSGIIAGRYSPENAALLIQPGVLDYFAGRVSTLNPTFKKSKLWAGLSANLAEVRKLAVKQGGAPPTADEVRAISALARATNDLIATPSD